MAETPSDFNLAGVALALQKRWKYLGLSVVVSLLVCLVVLLIMPKTYKSTAVVIPANPLLNDKGHFFNPNIEQLYSAFGTSDDLDRLIGVAGLDTTYKFLVDTFQLTDYYFKDKPVTPLVRRSAVLALMGDCKVQKNELNQLKISVWNKNAAMAAGIANAMIDVIQGRLIDVSQSRNQKTIEQFSKTIDSVQNTILLQERLLSSANISSKNINSTKAVTSSDERQKQLEDYQKIVDELKLANVNAWSSLYVLEYASPAAKADRPAFVQTLLAAFIASLLFGILFIALFDRRM